MEGVLLLKPTLTSMPPPQYSSPALHLGPREDSEHQASSSAVPPTCAAPAPPPPLPPPPPPPPLPPPLFASRNAHHRRSMKKVNWDAIPSQSVLGKLNIWTSQRPQRDLVLDIRSMEELFSQVEKQASLRRSRVMGQKRCEGFDLFPQEPQVTILDSKKSMNIGIFLRQFKRPVAEMVEDIRQGNWLRFGAGKLKELCKQLPEEREVKQLLAFSGNLSLLPEADRFMVQLVQVPGYEERLKTMVLREEFFPLMEDVKQSVAVMTKAANELLDCVDLHSVIRLVLKAGNYMNAGGYSANAIGFRMTSLLKLADTKANKPGMNLMHYVAKQAEDIDAELLTFPSQLGHIGKAARFCKEEVMTDFEKEVKKLKEVKLYASRQSGPFQQMETFFMRADAKLADMESSLRELNALSDAVAEYFCEDPSTFKLEECCSIFHSFCKRFDTAVQENREREAAEKLRKRKESFRLTSKRRSSSSDLDPQSDLDNSLESALHSFLSTVPAGIARCRRSALPPIEGSPSVPSPPEEEEEAAQGSPSSRRESPEKKQPKLQKGEEHVEELEEADGTRKVLRYQSCHDGDKVSGSPRRSETSPDTPATPKTPHPRTRDFFFANNGHVGSPWTILSPFASPQTNTPLQNRRKPRPRLSSEDELDDGVWQSDVGGRLSDSSDGYGPTGPSGVSASLPGCSSERAVSRGPVLRSVSVDETRQGTGSGFRLGGLFQRNAPERTRSYSSGSKRDESTGDGGLMSSLLCAKAENRLEGQAGTSGFISFFRRIGGRNNKPADVEEQNWRGSDT